VRRMILKWGGELAERYPVPAGILIGLIGLALIVVAFKEGPRLAEFDGGARVVGDVVTAGDDSSREPRFAADVTWTSEGKVPWETTKHRALVPVLQRELPHPKAADPDRRLRKGSALPLVISTKNPNVAMSAAAFEDELVLKLAGLRVLTIPLGIGLLCFVGGLSSVIQGVRAGRTPAPRTTPRRAQPAQARQLRR